MRREIVRKRAFGIKIASKKDRELIVVALETLDRLYKKGRHEVAAALRCKHGKIYSGIHIEAKYSGYADVCGEIAAICAAISDKCSRPDTIVSLTKTRDGKPAILEPCGRCRDIINDFDNNTKVIVGSIKKPKTIVVKSLIPYKSTNPLR